MKANVMDRINMLERHIIRITDSIKKDIKLSPEENLTVKIVFAQTLFTLRSIVEQKVKDRDDNKSDTK